MKLNLINKSGEKAEVDISDTEVNDFLEENWSDINNKFNIALKIGIITLRNASTNVDTSFVDKEFNKLQARFNDRFKNFQEEWDLNLKKVFGEDFAKMKECLDPDKKNTPTYRTVESIDNRINQLMKEMDPNDDSTPMGKFRKEMARDMQDLKTFFKVKETEDQVKEKGTAKGVEYEDSVHAALHQIGTNFGDTVTPTGKEPGVGGNKKGDIVVELSEGEGLKVVIEVKKKSFALNQKFYDDEIKGAMQTRGASMAILVVHPDYNPRGLPFYYFKDAIVAQYNPEVDDRTALSVAYQLARKVSIENSKKVSEGIDLNKFKDKLETIMAHVDHISKIEGAITNSINNLDKIKTDVQSTKEKLKDSLNDLIKEMKIEKTEEK